VLKIIKSLITNITTTPWAILMLTIESIAGIIQSDQLDDSSSIDSRELIPAIHDQLGFTPDWLGDWAPPGDPTKDYGL